MKRRDLLRHLMQHGCRLAREDIDRYLASLKIYPPSCVFLSPLTLTLSRRERE